MKSVKVNAHAKVNLYLDITGVSGGFHQLDTVVTSISLCDSITVTKRKDNKVLVTMRGSGAGAIERCKNNNATRAAEAFIKECRLNCGVDIDITKRIPIGGGLGGSSADIAGTLIAMQSLFGANCDIKKLADGLGSDSGYMLEGGWARLTGRGEVVERLPNINATLNLLIVASDGGCSTKECFSLYDASPQKPIKNGANRLIAQLIDNKLDEIEPYNALYGAACNVNPRIKEAFSDLSSAGASKVFMSGSGSSVCALFNNDNALDAVYALLKNKGLTVFKAQTLTREQVLSNTYAQ